MSSMPTTRFGLGVSAIGGKIYAIGGATDGIRSIYSKNNYYLIENEEFTLSLFNTNYNLTVNIIFPSENALLSGSTAILGTASVDAGTLKSVQIRIDNGSWITAIGTESWSYSLDTSNIKDGNHIISIRSYDGVGYSSTEMINVTVQNIQEIDGVTPGFELTIALFALVFILFWKRKRNR